jgi:transglutaminase-like putative cysteine protease
MNVPSLIYPVTRWFTRLAPLVLLGFAASGYSQSKQDDNIELYKVGETYEFKYDTRQKQVFVEETLDKLFLCNDHRAAIVFSEPYNGQESIEDVDVHTNGKKTKGVEPVYEYLNLDEYFYSDLKICHFPIFFPDMASQVDVKIDKIIHDPRYLSTVYLNEDYLVDEKTITVIVPRWMQVDVHTFHFEGAKVKINKTYDKDRDADVYTYTAENIPAMKKQSLSPGPTWLYPHILIQSKTSDYNGEKVTYFNNTNDLYQWCHTLTNQLHPDTALLGAKAREIATGITDPFEQMKAAFYWVEENVRYIAFEDGIAGFKPDEAHEVMRKKYGDCKGMANLTKELIRRYGLDARLCWIGTNHIMYDHSIPCLDADNHMICAVQYKGKWWFLDATEKYMQPGVYADRIEGREVMIENGDSCLLEHIPVVNADQNVRLFKEALVVSPDGVKGKVKYTYNGESKSDILYSINLTKKDRVQTSLESYITNSNTHYKISNLVTSPLDKRDGDLEVNFDLQYPDAVSSFGKEMYIDIDFNKEFNNTQIDTAKHTADIRFGSKDNYVTETELTIPDGYKATTVPDDLHVKAAGFSFDVTYKVAGNKINYHKQLKIDNTYLASTGFGEWNKAVTALSKKYLEQITLTQQ